MAQDTTNMVLKVWNLLSDKFNHTELAANFNKIDAHDHSAGKGKLIPAGALEPNAVLNGNIAPGAITASNLATNAVATANVQDGAISAGKIDSTLRPITGAGDGTEALRSLGTSSGQALPGNYAPLINATPTTGVSSSLPVSPANGREHYLLVGNGVAWHMRYNSSGGTYKWEFLGGSAIHFQGADQNLPAWSANVWGEYLTPDPNITGLPVGVYDVEYGGRFGATSGNNITAIQTGLFSGVNPALSDCMYQSNPAVGATMAPQQGSHRRRVTITTGYVRLRHWVYAQASSTVTLTAQSQFIAIRPVTLQGN